MGSQRSRIGLIVMAAGGAAIAGYLTYVHYAGISPVCTAGGGCEKVQTSTYSRLFGVPVAVLGLCLYTAILAALARRQNEATRLAAMGLTVIGFAFSGYLTYREIYTIRAICEWCVASAIVLTVMTPLSIASFLSPAAGRQLARGAS
jgi:uncharacterized membrane protein